MQEKPVYRHWDFKQNRVPTLEQVKDLALSKALYELIICVSPCYNDGGADRLAILKAYVDFFCQSKPYETPKFSGSDDGIQYLRATIRNASRLVTWWYYDNYEEFGKWLSEHPDNWLACDGEVRFDLFCYRYISGRRLETLAKSETKFIGSNKCPDWQDCVMCKSETSVTDVTKPMLVTNVPTPIGHGCQPKCLVCQATEKGA